MVGRYIIGIASLLSGDIDYSQSLFENLQRETQRLQTDVPAIVKIRHRLPVRLADVYLTQARFCYEEWKQTRSPEALTEMKPHLDSLELVVPGNRDGRVLRSILHFVVNHDIAEAKKELKKCRGRRDTLWLYNYAFLLAYEGNMTKALESYRRASKGYCAEPGILLEFEAFICWALEQEPDKVQLHFCLGLLNFLGKVDKTRALQDFEKFLEVASPTQFGEEMRLAEVYIETIRGELNAIKPD